MTDTTKLQVNFKTPGGALVNAYADDASELEVLLKSLQDLSSTIISTEKVLLHSGNVQNLIAQELGGQVVASTPAPAAESAIPDGHCKHGKLKWLESKPGDPKQWKGWFCPAPKGTVDQCKPRFINK